MTIVCKYLRYLCNCVFYCWSAVSVNGNAELQSSREERAGTICSAFALVSVWQRQVKTFCFLMSSFSPALQSPLWWWINIFIHISILLSAVLCKKKKKTHQCVQQLLLIWMKIYFNLRWDYFYSISSETNSGLFFCLHSGPSLFKSVWPASAQKAGNLLIFLHLHLHGNYITKAQRNTQIKPVLNLHLDLDSRVLKLTIFIIFR